MNIYIKKKQRKIFEYQQLVVLFIFLFVRKILNATKKDFNSLGFHFLMYDNKKKRCYISHIIIICVWECVIYHVLFDFLLVLFMIWVTFYTRWIKHNITLISMMKTLCKRKIAIKNTSGDNLFCNMSRELRI